MKVLQLQSNVTTFTWFPCWNIARPNSWIFILMALHCFVCSILSSFYLQIFPRIIKKSLQSSPLAPFIKWLGDKWKYIVDVLFGIRSAFSEMYSRPVFLLVYVYVNKHIHFIVSACETKELKNKSLVFLGGFGYSWWIGSH